VASATFTSLRAGFFMTDVSDQATIREEQEREMCLRTAMEPHKHLQATGRCHYCDEPVEGRFCGPECRDLWQAHTDARHRAGKR
jgi:hypothetical protein